MLLLTVKIASKVISEPLADPFKVLFWQDDVFQAFFCAYVEMEGVWQTFYPLESCTPLFSSECTIASISRRHVEITTTKQPLLYLQ